MDVMGCTRCVCMCQGIPDVPSMDVMGNELSGIPSGVTDCVMHG